MCNRILAENQLVFANAILTNHNGVIILEQNAYVKLFIKA